MYIYIYYISTYANLYTNLYVPEDMRKFPGNKSEHSGIKHFPLRFRLEVCCDVATSHWKRFGRPNHPLPVDLQDGGSYWAWLTLLHPFFKNGMLTEKWSKRHFDSIYLIWIFCSCHQLLCPKMIFVRCFFVFFLRKLFSWERILNADVFVKCGWET